MNNKIEKIFKKNFKKLKSKKKFIQMNMENTAGWDSIGHVNFLLNLEKAFNMKFTTKEFFELNSISKIIKRLKKK